MSSPRLIFSGMLVVCISSRFCSADLPTPGWIPTGEGIAGVDGNVYAETTWDPDGPGPAPSLLIVGGSFGSAGTATVSNVASWDGTKWARLGTGLGIVRSLIVFNGDLLAGGDGNVARWNGTTWVSFGQLTSVNCFAIYNGELIAGGGFSLGSINGLARWDGSSWVGYAGGVSGSPHTVSALTVLGSDLIVAGNFSSVGGGTSANMIARYNGTQWQSIGGPGGGDPTTAVLSLAVYNGDLIVGGRFYTFGGVAAYNVARMSAGNWFAMGQGMTSNPGGDDLPAGVSALLTNGGTLYAGGSFRYAGGLASFGTAYWDGSSWKPLGTGVGNAEVKALASYGSDLAIGGIFRNAGAKVAVNVARWDGTQWNSLGLGGFDGATLCSTAHNGELVAGGSFTQFEGVSMARIAGWNGASWHAFGNGLPGTPFALASFQGNLFAGGGFFQFSDPNAHFLAAWDGANWGAVGIGPNSYVNGLAVFQNQLIVSGDFTTAGGITVNHIARWNGTAWQALGSGMNLSVFGLAVYHNELYAGGDFSTAGGVPAQGIARWDGSAWHAVGSGMNANARVWPLTTYNDELIAAGDFTSAGGVSANHIARWNGTTWATLGPGLGGVNDIVFALATYKTDLFAGGRFPGKISRWDSTWHSMGANGDVQALYGSGCALAVGGQFTSTGQIVSPYLSLWRSDPTIAVQGQCAGSFATFTASTSEVSPGYQWRKNGINLSDGGHVSGSTAAIMTVGPFDNTDSADYDVVVTGNCGTVASLPISVSPEVLPQISGQPAPTLACPGGNAMFSVTATGGILYYQWRKGGINLSDGPGVSGAHSSVLTLSSVTSVSEGLYDVLVTDGCGTTPSQSAQLTLETAPTITSQPSSTVRCVDETATFQVGAQGAPPVTYRWRKNGVNLSDGGAISGATTPTLIINPVGVGSEGTYDCLVTDACGQRASNLATLTIPQGPPNFVLSPQSQDLCAGQELLIGGFATSNPSPTYQWKRNGQPIPGATSADYDVPSASASHSGIYELVAMNGCYSATSDPAIVNVFASATGDGNLDTHSNGLDISGFIAALLEWDGYYTAPYCAYDMNGDIYVDISDVGPFVNVLLSQ